MAVNADFWKGKRVFLTGHTGFKGSWMSLWLASMGAEITGFSIDVPTSPSLFDVANVSSRVRDIRGDIRDLPALSAAIRDARPDILIHMAAQPLVRLSYHDPVGTIATNVLGTANIFEALRKVDSVRVVVNVTSDKCYENKEWVWGYRENDPMGGYDPYSASKGCAELITSAFRNSFFNNDSYGKHGVAIASVRAGNVIGGGDWATDRLVPDILRAFDCGESVVIRNPNAIRPWQHVLEPISGYLLLAEKLWADGVEFSGGWNFGPNDSDTRPVSWIVDKLVNIWGEGAGWKLDDAEKPHEAFLLKLDCSKAFAILQWKPRWTLEQALENIVAWHKSWRSGENMQKYTISQISKYQKAD